MIKMTQLLLAGAVALMLLDTGLAQDTPARPPAAAPVSVAKFQEEAPPQEPLPEPLPSGPEVGVGGGILESLPRVPNVPSSLFTPPPQMRSSGLFRVDEPYLRFDPQLDDPRLGNFGWFFGAEAQFLKPHLIPGLSDTVHNSAQRAKGTSTTVSLPSGNLGWTTSPRAFVGYRLPSGFGEFMIAYRHLGTSGGGFPPGPNGPTALGSRFAFDVLDLDYNSRERSLGPICDMKWTIGLRSLFLFFEQQDNQSMSQAAAGNGIFQARQSNNLYGLGPHFGLQASRRLGDSNWSLYAGGDFAATFDWVNEGFSTRSTTLGPNGRPLFAETRSFGHQAAPMLSGRVGLQWQPTPVSRTKLFVGYTYEVIWDLDRVNNVLTTPFNNPSTGQYWSQGVVLQATFNY
jgi:hypothetical protein